MTQAIGIVLIILTICFLLYVIYATSIHYWSIKSNPKRFVVLVKGFTNALVLVSVIIMIISSMNGRSYIYGFVAFVFVIVVGGLLSFLLDVLIQG